MKTIYLVRHAAAAKGKPKSPDRKRALNKKGRKEAMKMAKKLKKNGMLPDLLVSSPAKRALQTARVFAQAIKYPKKKILLNKTLYEANNASSNEALLQEFRSMDDQFQSVIVFGHDPLLTEFARYLRKDFTEALPGCAVVRFDFNNISWTKITAGRGILKFFDYPNREKAQLDEKKKALTARLTEDLMRIFVEADPDTGPKMKKAIKKTVRPLTQNFLAKTKTKAKARETPQEPVAE